MNVKTNATRKICSNGLKATVIATTLLSASISHALDFEVGETKANIYGYVKGTFIYDLDHDLGRTTFGLGSITPNSELEDGNFKAHADESRLGLTTDTNGLKTKFEGDFFGGNAFRLRHAYGEYGNWLVGQNWTNFMPLTAYPGSVEFQGPAGVAFARKTQLRYTTGGLSLSLEDSAANSNQPALTAAYKLKSNGRTLRLSGLYTGDVTEATGEDDIYGITLAGTTPLWKGGNLSATFTTGEGVGAALVFGGNALDGNGEAIDTDAYTIGLTQKVAGGTAGLSYGKREDDTNIAGSTEELETIHLHYNFSPVKNVNVGIEYYTGERTINNGPTVDADRITTTVKYSF